jgi:hypothetical protein
VNREHPLHGARARFHAARGGHRQRRCVPRGHGRARSREALSQIATTAWRRRHVEPRALSRSQSGADCRDASFQVSDGIHERHVAQRQLLSEPGVLRTSKAVVLPRAVLDEREIGRAQDNEIVGPRFAQREYAKPSIPRQSIDLEIYVVTTSGIVLPWVAEAKRDEAAGCRWRCSRRTTCCRPECCPVRARSRQRRRAR